MLRARLPFEVTRDEFMGPLCLEKTRPDVALDDESCLFVLEILSDADWGPVLYQKDDYAIRQHRLWDDEKNTALFHGEELIGFYENTNLWIHPSHRGKRLSTPLILETAMLRGGSVLPNGVKAQHYTPAGFIAHRLAHLTAVVEAVKAGKHIPEKVCADYQIPLVPKKRSEWLQKQIGELWSNVDRRKYGRTALPQPESVAVMVCETTMDAHIVDVSFSGAGIRFPKPPSLAVGQEIIVKHKACEFSGYVVRINHDMVGILFSDPRKAGPFVRCLL